MTRFDYLEGLVARLENVGDVRDVNRSVQDHIRNGRGFWPVVTIDGEQQVVRFASSKISGALAEKWTPETGHVELIPLHALAVTDWPRVKMSVH